MLTEQLGAIAGTTSMAGTRFVRCHRITVMFLGGNPIGINNRRGEGGGAGMGGPLWSPAVDRLEMLARR
jgi:hypothetical protein